MVAICRSSRLRARGNPPAHQRRREMLWPMVIQIGRSRRVENPPFRSIRIDLLPSETFPSTVPTPELPGSAFSPISGPCAKSPKGSRAKTGAPSISVECVHDQSLASFSAQDCVPGLHVRPCLRPRLCRLQQVNHDQGHGHLSKLPDERPAQAAGCPWQPSELGGVAGRALSPSLAGLSP